MAWATCAGVSPGRVERLESASVGRLDELTADEDSVLVEVVIVALLSSDGDGWRWR